ncbi:hypothetical protein FisN_14Lu249 [Fistulifera solaris]|uniref:Uncharacterized protein n=1 Tax=Fistulifera solaris TaxID=1519565 RepID=A0A1Z5J9R5_FISSO|nr:hypothetical protein FisN_14Lu249 [Fistulifera solaris]|eukprot:GAX10709.1 hypothetical protein FisN_14Lu249 [Fistulifera solaris]
MNRANMSYEIPEAFTPILNTDVSRELDDKFQALFDKVIDHDHSKAEHFYQRIKEEVTAEPLLVRMINTSMENWSLLGAVCRWAKFDCQGTILFLIEQNPHALMWVGRSRDRNKRCAPIHLIGESSRNCTWLFWIVKRYPWVFEHKVCQRNPPHLSMVRCWANGDCESEVIRWFYEAYPQGLHEKERITSTVGKYALMVSLEGSEEPDADIFIWMAEQHPDAIYYKTVRGYSILHQVCEALGAKENEYQFVPFKCSPNMAKIARYLISEHSDLVRQRIHRCGYLLIHLLATRLNHPLVQEMVILLLKAYPECIQVKAAKCRPELSVLPFIQELYPLLMSELEVDTEIALLAQLSDSMANAVLISGDSSLVKNSFLGSISEIFRCWADLRIAHVSIQQQRIRDGIAEMCHRHEGEDVPDELVDEDDFWNEVCFSDYESDEEPDEQNDSDGDSASEFESTSDNVSSDSDNEDDWY